MRGWRIILILSALLWGTLDAFAIRAVHPGNPCTGDFGGTVSRARYYSPNLGRFWTMDTFQGRNEDPLSLHKYLYCRASPVNRMDPSGHEDMPSLVTTMGQIGYWAGRTYSAVNNAYWMTMVRLTPVIEKGWEALFWLDVATTSAGLAAQIAPDVLNLAADLGTRINKAYSLNTTPIPAAPGRGPGGQMGYGYTVEDIGGQQLNAMGGNYIGGNVKGIDGTLGVNGKVLISFKAHDVIEDNLLNTIKNDVSQLANLDPEAIKGTTVGGKPFQFEGSVSGRIVVIAVPQSQARYVISPQFINGLRTLAEETKTIPIGEGVSQ